MFWTYLLMHVIPPAGPVYAANTSGCRVASGIAGRLEKEIVKRKAWKTRQIKKVVAFNADFIRNNLYGTSYTHLCYFRAQSVPFL